MKITLLDGQAIRYDEAKTIKEIVDDISPSLGKKCVGALINGKEIAPLGAIIDRDCKIEIITERHELFESVVNYTAKLITSLALKMVLPTGTPVPKMDDLSSTEFYAYFDTDEKLKLEDIKMVEVEANKIINKGFAFSYITLSEDQYREKMRLLNVDSKYIEALLEENRARYIKFSTAILNGVEFLPRYAMLNNTSKLFKIELTELSGVYYDDDPSNKMIYKIHGIAAINEDTFEKKKKNLEDVQKGDHKNIAKTLEIYHFDPLIGQGLPIWLPNGAILKQEIKKYLMEKEFEYDFIQIETPIIGTTDLYKISGHWDHYRTDMFAPMLLTKEEMVLKPMSCPHHISVYKYKQRSYRDLPLRFAEHAIQHRYEMSGSLTGLERVRAMELTDSHIFARPDQIKSEFIKCFNLISEVLRTFDIKVSHLSLSLRDPKDKTKYFDDDRMWSVAETELEKTLKEYRLDYKKIVGEAAFYGPKLDIQAVTAQGHEITISTIQLDFLLPQKFDLSYIDKEGEEAIPIIIHRGLIGTYERFIAILLEQTKGVLPLWCTPIQVEILPVNIFKNLKYTKTIRQEFKKYFIRTHIDSRDERLSYRIRDAQIKKIPFQLVIGDSEEEANSVTYRRYGLEEQTTVSLEDFIEMINKEIHQKNYINN